MSTTACFEAVKCFRLIQKSLQRLARTTTLLRGKRKACRRQIAPTVVDHAVSAARSVVSVDFAHEQSEKQALVCTAVVLENELVRLKISAM